MDDICQKSINTCSNESSHMNTSQPSLAYHLGN